MPLIRETIVTTENQAGITHIAPIGLIEEEGGWVIAPFRPSTTLENLKAHPFAVANYCDDVRIFAGCLTGRKDWPLIVAEKIKGSYLQAALTHVELEVVKETDDDLRPRFHCRVLHQETHRPFCGFNRAQSAVLEAAILATRLNMLPREKVSNELDYLTIAIEKTAGPNEREAWSWIMEKMDRFYAD